MTTDQRERLYRADAVVLRRRDMGEADRLLTCFTRERGKLTLIAKGARKTTSRKAGHIELFSHSRLLVARARTWDIVTQADAVNVFLPLREDLQRTAHAYYVAELLDRFTEEQDEHQAMFDLVLDTLSRLCRASELRLPTRYYELHLLGLAGFQPELFVCLACREPIQPIANYFHIARGGLFCPRCASDDAGAREVSLPALKVLRYLQTRPYTAVELLQLRESVHREIEELLHHYLIYVLEQQVKSVDFLHLLRRQLGAGHAPAATPDGS
jgi:DNA repair protein RecO (recombination protein O)